MKLIFDLDGTLICVKRRLFELFSSLENSRSIDFDLFCALKSRGLKNEEILSSYLRLPPRLVDKFLSAWMEQIEHEEYLNLDSVIPGVREFLNRCSNEHELFICTARQSSKNALDQLDKLDILRFFKDVFVTEQVRRKCDLLHSRELNLCASDWFIGDTGHDVIAGKALGLKTCAVLSGFMTERALCKYSPDIVLSNVTSFYV